MDSATLARLEHGNMVTTIAFASGVAPAHGWSTRVVSR
jgi:hypothetical protein